MTGDTDSVMRSASLGGSPRRRRSTTVGAGAAAAVADAVAGTAAHIDDPSAPLQFGSHVALRNTDFDAFLMADGFVDGYLHLTAATHWHPAQQAQQLLRARGNAAAAASGGGGLRMAFKQALGGTVRGLGAHVDGVAAWCWWMPACQWGCSGVMQSPRYLSGQPAAATTRAWRSLHAVVATNPSPAQFRVRSFAAAYSSSSLPATTPRSPP